MMTIARLQKACDLLEKANPGYDQGNRRSFYDPKTLELRKGGELDCSIGCGWIAAKAGYPVNLKDPFWTGNFTERLLATGLFRAIRFTKLSQLKPGDFLVGPGHVVFVRDAKRWWSAEVDERGRASGGKAGDQTGREARFRAPYLRSAGWSYIVRLVSPASLLRRAIDLYAAGQSPAEPLRLLRTRAPWDGPRWTWFLDMWAAWDRGMTLHFDPDLDAPPARHAFVVLGSALTTSGQVSKKFGQRLQLAQAALLRNPESLVLITGGAPKAGVTEAEAGRRWLVAGGIEADRILTETKSASTVGNATNSVPILLKAGIQAYTLVSHASHLRRAAVLFVARTVQLETVDNRVSPLGLHSLLAVDDYAPKPAKPALPVTAQTRKVIASEVKHLLDLEDV